MPVRSKTYGAAHPAFAVLINRALKVVVVAVRGSKGKKDHLIDIDFQYDLLLSEAEAKVPRTKPLPLLTKPLRPAPLRG